MADQPPKGFVRCSSWPTIKAPEPDRRRSAITSVGVEWGEGMATLVISVLFPLTTF
jgi:hypothetical protein